MWVKLNLLSKKPCIIDFSKVAYLTMGAKGTVIHFLHAVPGPVGGASVQRRIVVEDSMSSLEKLLKAKAAS